MKGLPATAGIELANWNWKVVRQYEAWNGSSATQCGRDNMLLRILFAQRWAFAQIACGGGCRLLALHVAVFPVPMAKLLCECNI